MVRKESNITEDIKCQDWQITVIHRVLKDQTEGIRISVLEEYLEKVLPFQFNRRTLQRRLTEMRARKMIYSTGNGRLYYYHSDVCVWSPTERKRTVMNR